MNQLPGSWERMGPWDAPGTSRSFTSMRNTSMHRHKGQHVPVSCPSVSVHRLREPGHRRITTLRMAQRRRALMMKSSLTSTMPACIPQGRLL
jgi:hypothetical protein